MLVLSRRVGDAVWIGDDIRIVITEIRGDRIRLGIDAPEGLHILREEIKTATISNIEAVSPVVSDTLISDRGFRLRKG